MEPWAKLISVKRYYKSFKWKRDSKDNWSKSFCVKKVKVFITQKQKIYKKVHKKVYNSEILCAHGTKQGLRRVNKRRKYY